MRRRKIRKETFWREGRRSGAGEARSTHEEAQMTAAQTLEVVYGLFENMKVVMDGEQQD
jgi:hypothetical protein